MVSSSDYMATHPKEISLRSEFIKAFPPFLIYLGTAIILLSFFKDLVRVGFHTSWLLIRMGYLPFVLIVWCFATRKLITTRFYEAPLWIAGFYITLLCTYFSFATGGLNSDYIYGLIQFYFAIAIMPVTAITFYMLSLSSISIYIGLNILNFNSGNLHDYTMISTLVPLLVFSAVVYFITSRIRHAKINLHNMLSATLMEMDETIKIQSEKLVKIETKEALGVVAVQMAHDIRSPLAALNVIAGELGQLPEALRIMTRGAITRINDIANNLLNKYKQCSDETEGDSISPELISDAIDSVISEIRVQIQDTNIELDYIVDITAQGVFCKLQLVEFKRIISNLINNAIESIIDQGRVVVKIVVKDDTIIIDIKDNGCGISPDNFKNLFREGYTSKKNGSGLGLVYAKRAINLLGGDIAINSDQFGTTVSLRLLKCPCPEWFTLRIKLSPNLRVAIIDDDTSIAKVWESRLLTFIDKYRIELIHFNNIKKLVEWHTENSHLLAIYLCDYEFTDQSMTGLDVIEQLKISNSSFLVTSRYEDLEIRKRCADMQLKIIPKNFSAYIPVQVIY